MKENRQRNRRILVIDDNKAIHEDYRAILEGADADTINVDQEEAGIFGAALESSEQERFEVDSAFQGQNGLEKVQQALYNGRPYAMAFVDMRMPPGWDGVETIQRIWEVYPELQIVICTAYSDYSWHETVGKLGKTAQLLILKKPSDNVEVYQLACALTEKWLLARQARLKQKELEARVKEQTAELNASNDLLRQEITERKQAEKVLRRTYEDLEIAHRQLEDSQAQLIQTEKMSALGTLVAGTAHELNNPITGILNFAAHCKKHTSEQDQLYTVLQDIEHEAKRCAEIVRNLLTFSRAEQDDDKAYQKGNLAEILGRVLKLLSYRIEKQGISVTWHIDDDTPEIFMNSNNIQQLNLNLTTNAFDALEESEKKEFNVDIHREGEFVRMTITDTGCGIAAESLGSIFDPFFSTKPTGQGTGLGLSVSQGIVKVYRGKISCESELGEGTKFTILLPIEKIKEKANV